MVFFRKSDVLVAGDVYVNTTFPVINVAQGGSHQRHHRGAEPHHRHHRAAEEAGGRHLRHSRARPPGRRSRRRRVSRHVHDHPRPLRGRGRRRGRRSSRSRRRRLVRDYEGRYGAAQGSGPPTRSSRRRIKALGATGGDQGGTVMTAESFRGSRSVCGGCAARARARGRIAARWRRRQQPAAPAPAAAGHAARRRAPIDLTGYWVSIVNEDWRWRMVTPPKGDFASVPLNAEGTQGGQHVGPGDRRLVPGLRRGRPDAHADAPAHHVGGRPTLKIETDAGQQTRRAAFDGGARAGAAVAAGLFGGGVGAGAAAGDAAAARRRSAGSATSRSRRPT